MKRAAKTLVAGATATALLAGTIVTEQALPEATGEPVAHAAATCSDYANQKAAQEAADTRDGDGIYCVIYLQ